MADEQDDKNADYEEGSLLDRIKESPRTVSALIIILIVAAAIYAFSGNNTTPGQTDEVAVNTEEGSEATEEGDEESDEAKPDEDKDEEAASPAASPASPTPQGSTPQTQAQLQDEAKKLSEPRKTDTGYTEVAQAGEGSTHLARRAATRWLAENQAGYDVTREHRIYIEDYIKDRLGSQGLAVGQEQAISFDLVKEAVASAQQLNSTQLQNLNQYTYALT